MGGCCGKVAPKKSAVIRTVIMVLEADKKGEDLADARGEMLTIIENCLDTYGGWHPVSALASWALGRLYNIMATQASSAEEKQYFLKVCEENLKHVYEYFKDGGDFPPLSLGDFPPEPDRRPPEPDATKWPGYRESCIADQLAMCIKLQGGRVSEVCEILERVVAATEAAEGATAGEKLYYKVSLAGVMGQVPAKADEAITLMTSLVDDLTENPDQAAVVYGGSEAGRQIYEMVSGTLAAMLAARNKWADLETVKRKHVTFLEKTKGPEDESLCPVMHLLCQALLRQDKWAEVEPIMRRARKITYSLGMERALAESLIGQGGAEKSEEAETIARACLTQVYEDKGPDHLNTFGWRSTLVNSLENLDKLDEAEEQLRAMLQSLPNILSPGHPLAAQTVGQLVQILAKLDRVDEAVALQQEYLAKWEEGGPPRGNMPAQYYFNSLSVAAAQFDKLGKHDLAEPIYRNLVRFVAPRLPGEPAQVAYIETVKLLATNLEKQGKQAEADELRKETLVGALKRAAGGGGRGGGDGGGEEEKI